MDLDELHNLKKGQDCYILACGPSLKKYDNEETRELLKTKLVFSIKQAYDKFKHQTPNSVIEGFFFQSNSQVMVTTDRNLGFFDFFTDVCLSGGVPKGSTLVPHRNPPQMGKNQ